MGMEVRIVYGVYDLKLKYWNERMNTKRNNIRSNKNNNKNQVYEIKASLSEKYF